MRPQKHDNSSKKGHRRKYIILLLALSLLVLVVVGAWSWYYLSEILRGRIVVREQPYQLLKIYANFPTEVVVGQEFTVYFTVENPNPETIRGVMVLNISRPGIHPDHVRIFTDARYGGCSIEIHMIWDPPRYSDKIIYILRPGGWGCDRYFYFTPGNNTDILWIRMYFNDPGEYDYEVGVAWLE